MTMTTTTSGLLDLDDFSASQGLPVLVGKVGGTNGSQVMALIMVFIHHHVSCYTLYM